MILNYLITFGAAVVFGKLVSKLKLPTILGWLLAGMVFGPYALNLLNDAILSEPVYEYAINILECSVGLMIGTELVWKKIKAAGKQIIVTTLTQSLGTFFFVSLVFGIVFYFTGTPVYLAFIFGGIALATAPAPPLSIVREFRTTGPVTKTLIPMAALDDMVGVVVFFSVIAVVSGSLSADSMPAYMIPLFIGVPLLLGGIGGLISGLLMRKMKGKWALFCNLLLSILAISAVGIYINYYLFPAPILNFMLIGMAYSAVFANLISEEKLDELMGGFQPILTVSIDRGHLKSWRAARLPSDFWSGRIYGSLYSFARLWKILWARFGASVTKAPDTVRKYLGFTLLPHSGVSLVFTGIAVNMLTGPAPECAKIVQGTIAAAAVINEIIAVIVAKKGFEWAGEMAVDR